MAPGEAGPTAIALDAAAAAAARACARSALPDSVAAPSHLCTLNQLANPPISTGLALIELEDAPAVTLATGLLAIEPL